MVRLHRSRLNGYVFALISVAIAVGARHLLQPALGAEARFALVLLAVLMTARIFGLRPAIFSVVVGALGADYVLLEPRGSFGLFGLSQQLGMLLFVVCGLGIAFIAGYMHDAQAALREANRLLEQSVGERTGELTLRERQLERSEDRLRFALMSGQIGGWDLDLTTLTSYRTPEHDRIFGYDPPLDDWNYGMFFEHVLPEDREEVDRIFYSALDQGKGLDFECRIRRADGALRWIWITGKQTCDDQDRPFRMTGIVQDITDRKQSEIALQERERFLAVVTDSSRVGLVAVGPGYRYLFANRAYADIFDLPTGDIVGRHVPEILPAAWAQIQPRLDRALAGGRVNYELALPGVDGGPVRHFAVNYEPYTSETGEPSVVVVVMEITERKHAELALAERERMLQFVTSSACVGLVVLGSDYRYLFANEAYGRLYGLDVSTIIGRTVPEVIPFAWPQIKPHLDRSLSGTPGGFDLMLPPLPGSEFPRTLAVSYEPHRREDGAPTSVVVISDVSERKQAADAAARLSERVTLAARAARFGVWDWDLVEDKITWDDQMYTIYGRQRNDFQGAYDAWLAGVHPEDRARCDEESQRARDGLMDYETEFRIFWPDGSLHYVKAIGDVFWDEAGRPVRMLGVNFDITEARLAAMALQQSQARLEAALSSMADAVFIADESQRLIRYNGAFVTFHRFPDKAACDEHIDAFDELFEVFQLDGTPVPLDRWAVPRALSGEVATNVQCVLRRIDNGEQWYASYSFGPIRDSDGNIVGAVVVGRDVTELRMAERAIREQESRFKQIADNIREVFWMIDLEQGTMLYVSPAYETVWGRTLDSLYRNPSEWMEAVHPEDRTRVEKLLENQQQGTHYEVDYRILHPNGDVRWIRDLSFPIRDDSGKLYRYAGVAEDITERRLAELASQRHQKRLEGIVDSAMDGIITLDEGQHVILMNAAAERMFGSPSGDVLGTHVGRFIPERNRALHEGHVREFGRTGVAARAMGRFGPISGLRANGEEFPLEASISQIEVDGHKLYTVTCRDVSERLEAEANRKKLESQLQQSQRMEAFGQLAGGVAHDFNNLLTIINGYSEWLLDTPCDETMVREHLEEIHRAGERAAALTRQLLTFSRQQVIEPRVLALNSVVEGVESMLRRLIGEDVRLTMVLRPTTGKVNVDPVQIEQVILNLALNARDAMPQGGQLTIETDLVELDAAYTAKHAGVAPGHYVLLAVSDTGSGMPREVRDRIFEPFFTTKGPGRGTGLGLAVVHGIVKQSGGHADVYSEVGKGTTLKIYFPPAEFEPVAQSEGPVGPAPRGGETVLLVEDEESVREMTAMALSAFGYTVLTASLGREAIDIMAEHEGRVDLLITDVIMPEMSGSSLAEALLQQYPALKVLFISGYTDDAVMRHGVLQSEVAFLQKPYTLGGLSRKVRDVLDGC